MKTKYLKIILILTIIFSTQACDDILSGSDPCDDTALEPAKSISIRAVVNATNGDFGNNENIVPIKVRFYKISCGENEAKPGSTFTYSGNLERPNFLTYTSGTPSYNLRNADDKIVVELLSDYDLDGVYDYIKYQEYYNAAHLSNTTINSIQIDY